jgi:hypothetical protein
MHTASRILPDTLSLQHDFVSAIKIPPVIISATKYDFAFKSPILQPTGKIDALFPPTIASITSYVGLFNVLQSKAFTQVYKDLTKS